MNTIKRGLLGALLLLAATGALAQTGSIDGRIVDADTGEELIGASILVVGTTIGTATDLDGNYTLPSVRAGSVDLRISYMGYEAKVVTGVEVPDGGQVEINVSLRAEGTAFVIDDMVVSADRVLSTGLAILAERKKSAIIGDAISSEQIARSPDATSGDALKRVTGLTVADNKFVFVRGVTDRYNGTTLNGVSVTGTEANVDKKSFAFDLIPANLLANTVVVKTATPDLPGDFSGGLVQVNTLEFPTERVTKLTLGLSYSPDSNMEDFISGQGGDTDWLGIDDGDRDRREGRTYIDLARHLPNTWGIDRSQAPLNGSLNLALGDRYLIGDDEFGYIGALTYKNSYSSTGVRIAPSQYFEGIGYWTNYDLEGTRYENSVLWGGLLNLHYKLSGKHKLSLKNNFNQSGTEKVSLMSGSTDLEPYAERQIIEWDQRRLWVTQLGGEHFFPGLGDLEVEWQGATSHSTASQPDRKYVDRSPNVYGDLLLKENYRTWSGLSEDATSFDLDLTRPFRRGKIKTGFGFERRQREFDAATWYTDPRNTTIPDSLLYLPVDSLFMASNYADTLFLFEPSTPFTGDYQAEQTLLSAYAMFDRHFTVLDRSFRFVGGARIEDVEQTIDTTVAEDDPTPLTTGVDKTDVLPSANLTYLLNDETNIRLAYSHSVNRPEFRELANVLYYDFDREQNVRGNDELSRALIRNYDLRVEYFPDIGDVLAASYFHKEMRHVIEETLISSPERFVRTWFNSQRGRNSGYELEVRKNLGFLGDPFAAFSLTGNYTRVWSEIEYEAQGETRTREMQGQAPWSLNLSLQYTNPRFGTVFNVLYNKIARRLDAVSSVDKRDEDVYEESRDILDLAVSQRFGDRWSAKLTVKNALGEDRVYTMGPNGDPDESFYSEYSGDIGWSFTLGMNF